MIETSTLTKSAISEYISKGKRFDKRQLSEFRNLSIDLALSKKAEGGAKVKLGKTEVWVGVKMEIAEPYPDSPDKGNLMVTAELLPLSSSKYEYGPPKFNAIEIGRLVDRGIRESKFIDFEKLCIKEGEKVWAVIIDIYSINDDGNLLDAAFIGALAALKSAKMPFYDEKKEKIDYEAESKKKIPLTKNNPINWENIQGKAVVVESGMRVLYAMMLTDFQRDLRGSVQARYQPQGMMTEVHEMFGRASKELRQLSLNRDKVAEHLQTVRDFPSEAMVAILRGEGYVHPTSGEGHEFVKVVSRRAKGKGKSLLDEALTDIHFKEVYDRLPEQKQRILRGELELYLGHSLERARQNIAFARSY